MAGPSDEHRIDQSRRFRRGRSGEGPVTLAQSLGAVANRLGVGRVDLVGAIFSRWDDLVGPSVATHVKPIRLDGETLVVAVDHPAWATQLRHLAPEILARVAEVCGPEGAPTRLEVKVRH